MPKSKELGDTVECSARDIFEIEGLPIMPQLVMECPHCLAGRIGFAPRGSVLRRPDRAVALIFLQCEGCGEIVVASAAGNQTDVTNWMQGHTATPGRILETYPGRKTLKAPDDVPKNVGAAFLSGLDNLGRQNGANAAGAMFRRAIELAARAIDADAPARIDLKQRIERLPDTVVTPSMKEWAQHIRLEGNEALHELEEYTDQDAKDLHSFAELFLTYAFTLPAMLEKAKTEDNNAS